LKCTLSRAIVRLVPLAPRRRDNSKWLRGARGVLEGSDPPKLHFVLGADVNRMTQRDMLLSYALAAYLLEAHPDAVVPIELRRLHVSLAHRPRSFPGDESECPRPRSTGPAASPPCSASTTCAS